MLGEFVTAAEIADAVANLAGQPFDATEFPYQFLESFGNRPVTIKRLREGSTNRSDVEGGVLQTNNIHIAVAQIGKVSAVLADLVESAATARYKTKFVLATDGQTLEAQSLTSGELLAIDYKELANNFVMFLPLAGITIGRELKNSDIDIRATNGLNKLYVELLKENTDWGNGQDRGDMNSFMARLIFCFFAEDTGILPESTFTRTIDVMSERDASNVHEIIRMLFHSMALPHADRPTHSIPTWANDFPYVNGGLFSGEIRVPKFTRAAKAYLLQIGGLNWRMINPDIFGSMTQAIADDDERGNLGMHYTSVPNILKVLNPLFLDDLKQQLDDAGDNSRKLLNLRNRISRIRVFDPACGGGNFLVIAYKELRALEAEINRRRGEPSRASEIPLTNFRGIEIQSFAAEIARLALIIAEYQSDVLYRGHLLALNEFLPLQAENWITNGNALRLDWLKLCPPSGTLVEHAGLGLFPPERVQAEIDFTNEGGETYVCGNPPYLGHKYQSKEQKADLEALFAGRTKSWKKLDYVSAWFIKAADYGALTGASTAFVSTNSVTQGEHVPILWPPIFSTGHQIHFAHTSFRWSNLASHNAGVTVVVVGLTTRPPPMRFLYSIGADGEPIRKEVPLINAYLIAAPNVIVTPSSTPTNSLPPMHFGNMPRDGQNLLLDLPTKQSIEDDAIALQFIRPFIGSDELINGRIRYCIWIEDHEVPQAIQSEFVAERLQRVREQRAKSAAASTRAYASQPHRFVQIQGSAKSHSVVIPRITSENRDYLPVGYAGASVVVSSAMFALYDVPIWNFGIASSRLHWIWIDAVCGKLETRFHYSNTIGWNTFPVPTLTEQNKGDLTRAAEDILLARETHFPATIAELYDPNKMPENLRRAHEHNDEIIERIYIGRRFKNDTERLEKLFDLYQKAQSASAGTRKVTA